MSLSDFAIDLNKEETGVWMELGDMEFLVARAGNDEWQKLSKRLETQTYGNRRNPDKRDAKKDGENLIKCLAYTGVLDWKNVRLEDGEDEIPYDKETCYDILSDKKYRIVRDTLLEFALEQENFMEEQIEEDSKK